MGFKEVSKGRVIIFSVIIILKGFNSYVKLILDIGIEVKENFKYFRFISDWKYL